MTYWVREHEQNLRRIGDAIRDLEDAYENIIPTLIHELKEDDDAATFVSRESLTAARKHLAAAMERLEEAKRDLPEPQRGPRFPQTAAEVMRRDG